MKKLVNGLFYLSVVLSYKTIIALILIFFLEETGTTYPVGIQDWFNLGILFSLIGGLIFPFFAILLFIAVCISEGKELNLISKSMLFKAGLAISTCIPILLSYAAFNE